ncbi:MAG: hypothetical protein K2P81_01480 [Bacteriovoracaceae bacterium]|nr:hypothetical protein [Bacteriovoracaceae bacterium]
MNTIKNRHSYHGQYLGFFLVSILVGCSTTGTNSLAIKSNSSISENKSDADVSNKHSLNKIKQSAFYLNSIKDQKSIDYEIAISDFSIDVKNATKVALESGDSQSALYLINLGTESAPFRGDLLDLKKRTISKHVEITKVLLASNSDCGLIYKRIKLLSIISPDNQETRKMFEAKCRDYPSQFTSNEIDLNTFIVDYQKSDQEKPTSFKDFYTYSFPSEALLLEFLKYFQNLRLKSEYIKDSSPRLLVAQLKISTPIKQMNFEDDFCRKVSSILTFDGEHQKMASCGSTNFHASPRVFYDISTEGFTVDYLPKILILKVDIFYKNGTKKSIQLDALIKRDLVYDYTLAEFFYDTRSTTQHKKPSSFYKGPEFRLGESTYLNDKRIIGSLAVMDSESKLTLHNINSRDVVGVEIYLDPMQTINYYRSRKAKKLVNFMKEINTFR